MVRAELLGHDGAGDRCIQGVAEPETRRLWRRSARERTPAPGSPGSSTRRAGRRRIVSSPRATALSQATTLEGDALDELQAVAESEIGELYVDGAGQVVFRNRRATLTEARSNTVQFTFGSTPGSPQPYIARLNTDDATLWNDIRPSAWAASNRWWATPRARPRTCPAPMRSRTSWWRPDILCPLEQRN